MKPVPTNACAVCGKAIGRDLLMCLPHWREVPLNLQREVNRTWRYANHNARTPQDKLVRLASYRKARDAAIAAASLGNPSSTTPEAP